MARKVKQRRKGITRLSSKNQATIPVAVLEGTGVRSGDPLRVEAAGPGEIRLVSLRGRIDRFAGVLPGAYPKGYLRKIRGEWR